MELQYGLDLRENPIWKPLLPAPSQEELNPLKEKNIFGDF